MKRHKIGIFGSAADNPKKVIAKAKELGKVLGKQNAILVTGASTGLPYEVASIAHKSGLEIWGFSPAINLVSQTKLFPDCDPAIYKKLFYIPAAYEFLKNPAVCLKYRNVSSTATVDAGIIISGRWGSMNEFTNLYDMGKVIGVLTGTGGIADELEDLNKKIAKKSNAVVFFHGDPKELIQRVLKELNKRK